MQATKTFTGSERVSLSGSRRDIRQQKGSSRRVNNHVFGGAEKPLLFLHMKRILIEILFILILSLFVSLIYTAVSPSGMNLLKKTFGISDSSNPADFKADPEGKSKAGME